MTRRRALTAAAGLSGVVVLAILSNGPLFVVARHIYHRPGFWEDPFIRPLLEAVGRVGLVIGVLELWRGPRQRSLVLAGCVAAFSSLALWSTTWSVSPTLTWWRSLVYLGLVGVAWVVAGVSLDALRDVVAGFAGMMVLASVVMVVAVPRIGVDPVGDWRGVYTNPNSLAPVCALLVMAGIALICQGGARRVLGALAVACGVGVLLQTGGETATISLVIAVGLSGSLVIGRRLWLDGRRRLVWRSLLVGAPLVVLAVTLGLPALWSAPTFRRRRELWELVWDRIVQRPVRGFGFFAFWDVQSLIQPYQLREAGSAHNSWLEVLLGLGVVGLVVFVAITSAAVVRPLLSAWRRPDDRHWFPAALAVFCLLENLTESFVLWFSYIWVLICAMAMAPVARPGDRPRRGDPPLVPSGTT